MTLTFFGCCLEIPLPGEGASNPLDIDLEPVKEGTSKMASIKP